MANQFKKQLGGALRRARTHRGRTQAEVAETVGISVEALSRIERGITAPAASTLLSLMQTLDLERDDLLSRKSPSKRSPYSKEIMAIAEALSRAPQARLTAIRKVVQAILKME